MQPQPREGGAVPPASYHAIENKMWYPVEFVNDKWYWLEWDNMTKFRGYWTRLSKEIPPGTSNLGWDGRKEEAPTPQPLVGSSFTETRERAESASTQAKEELPQELEDDDFIDTNPEQTEQLAEHFEGLRQALDEDLAKGYIRHGTSSYVSPIFFIPKKDGAELRMVIDYRRLNEISKKDFYPLPNL